MVVILFAGLAVAGYWWILRPQVITFKDGSKLTLIGVTYGKNHVAPKIKIGGKLTRGSGAQMNSADNALVVWVEYQHKASQNRNQYPNYQFFIYDKAGTACVGNYTTTQSQVNNAVSILGYMFNAYPRWDNKMIVRVASNGNGNRQVAKEQFVISNPKHVSVTQWTPEAMPDKKTDGDLAVTLTKLDAGARGFNGMGSPKDPMSKAVLAVFHTEQNGVTATNWQPVGIATSDASGNHAQNNSWSTSRDANGDATMTYQWGLWPDQPWKLRVEMSRTAGFSADEFWSVTNVPVLPGNQQDMYNYNYGNGARRDPRAFAETTLNGIHLKIYPAIQFTNVNMGNNQKQGGFRVMADPDPTSQGFRMTTLQHDRRTGTRTSKLQRRRGRRQLLLSTAKHPQHQNVERDGGAEQKPVLRVHRQAVHKSGGQHN